MLSSFELLTWDPPASDQAQQRQLCLMLGGFFFFLFSVAFTESPHSLPIHREAPLFTDQSTEQEILETGIKVSATPGLMWNHTGLRTTVFVEEEERDRSKATETAAS